MTGRQGEARVWCKVGITFWRGAAPSASTCIPFHTSRRHSIRQCVQQTPSFWHSARKVVATCYESAKTRMQGRSRGKMKRRRLLEGARKGQHFAYLAGLHGLMESRCICRALTSHAEPSTQQHGAKPVPRRTRGYTRAT